MAKQKFQQQMLSFLTSKKGADSAYKTMSKGTSPTKRKYFRVGDVIGYIKALEAKVEELIKYSKGLQKEIALLNKQLAKYNLSHSPKGVSGYIFFSQDEYNGIKYIEKDLEKVIHDVKKEVVRKYYSSALAGYNKK